MNLCDYGCGKEAKFQIGQKWCCSSHWSRCENKILNLVKHHKGKKRSLETCQKIRNTLLERTEKIKQKKIKEKENIKYLISTSQCSYGCGKPAKFYFQHVKKYCCELYLSKCPSQKERLNKQNIGIPIDKNILCSYGCGNNAKYFFKNSKNYCCSERPQICPSIMEKNSKKNIISSSEKNNSMWLGGIRSNPYSTDFRISIREKIKKRDNYKCMNPDCLGKCNYKYLHVHHIDYNKMNSAMENLITLCASCHGKAIVKREYWQSFYKEIMRKNYLILEQIINIKRR